MQAQRNISRSCVLSTCDQSPSEYAVVDIQDIRRKNLDALLREVETELGQSRGAAAELSRRTQVPAPFISQFLKARKHQGGGVRSMGDETARKLERGTNKPKGWMDVTHDDHTTSDAERRHLLTLRLLTPAQRELLERQAIEFARLNGNAPPPEQQDNHVRH